VTGSSLAWQSVVTQSPVDIQDSDLAMLERIRSVGSKLRRNLEPLLGAVGASRPAQISRAYGLDISLTSRLVRGLNDPDPLVTLRRIPSPEGLRMLLSAAQRAGVASDSLAAAERSIADLEGLIGEFGRGRAALDAVIDGWSPKGREEAERAGRHAIFKATSQVLGYSTGTMAQMRALAPNPDGTHCDMMGVQVRDDIRRLRRGSLIPAFGTYLQGDEESGIVETLAGERKVTDARRFLIQDYADSNWVPLRMLQRGPMVRLALDRDVPPINRPVSLANGQVIRRMFRRHATDACRHEGIMSLVRTPARLLIHDVLLHEDLFPNFEPNCVPRLHYAPTQLEPDDELVDFDRVELDVRAEDMGRGLEELAVAESPRYLELLRHGFESVGWNPGEFRACRCRVVYPVISVSVTTWIPLE
jgi:hypothetical protein